MIACILDAGNLSHAGPVAPSQILSIFGANLGPAIGVVAPDQNTTSLGGVGIAFDGIPARLIYVSSSQINVVVPPPAVLGVGAMQVSVNGKVVQRQLPFTASNVNLFAEIATKTTTCQLTSQHFRSWPSTPMDRGMAARIRPKSARLSLCSSTGWATHG